MIKVKHNNTIKTVNKIYSKKSGILNIVKKRCIKNNNYNPMPRLLPKGYRLVDGLITDGVAYVDTGIVPDTTSKWDFYGTFKVAQSGDQVILGSREDSGNTRFFPFATAVSGVQKANYAYSAYAYGNDLTLNAKSYIYTHLEAGTQSSQVEGSERPDTRGLDFPSGTTLTKSLYLFRNNYSAPNECKAGLTCWYIKAVKDGVTVGEFVSCRRDSDGAYGLYDFVTNTFKGNANTSGTLSGGKDIIQVEYLQSSGVEYIDTGIGVGSNDIVECTWENVFQNGSIVKVSTENKGWGGSLSNSGINFYGFNGGGREHNGYISFWLGTHFDTTISSADTEGRKFTDRLTVDGSTTYIKMLENDTELYNATYNRSTYTNPRSVYLFKDNSDDPYPGVKKIYSYIHTKNGSIVRNYIPIRIGTVGYMLDIANWRIYGNQGTGAFTYGNDVFPYKVVFNALPNEYQEVEYLQSSGTQYIDTGLKGNQDTEFDIIAQYVGASTSSLAGLFGTRTSAQNKAVIVAGYAGQVITGFGNAETQVVFNFNEHYFKLVDDNYYYDGTLIKAFSPSTFETDSTMILFGRRNGSTMSLSAWKVKKLYVSNGTNKLYFVPCYRKSDYVAGMYDIINGAFYTNQGTGDFTCGREIY